MRNYKELLANQIGDTPVRAFAVLVDNEFATALYYPQGNDAFELLCAALASDPKIVEITHLDSHPEIPDGWTWNGFDFDPPVESTNDV